MNDLTGKEWLQNSFSIWRELSKSREEKALKHPAMFPQTLAEKLMKIYLNGTEKSILDPFSGIGSTVLAAEALGHKAIGIDLNPEYCDFAKQRLAESLFVDHERDSIYCDDSVNLLEYVLADSVDLAITSPPYWNILNQKRTADKKDIRNYSDSSDDLGNIDDYEEYLEALKKVFGKVYIALKMNSRCISIVMDIRKKDRFFPLHEDQTRIMREIGFELEEYVIWDRQAEYNNMKTLGYPYVFRFNKVHEFICIYWKR